MPSVYDDPNLASARQGAQAATSAYQTEAASAGTLPDMLRDALNKKFSANNPIYADRETAAKSYFDATTQAPLRVTPRSAGGMSDVVYTPAEQANLIQGYRSAPLARLMTLNDLLNLNTGGIENVIGATSRAHGSIVDKLLGQANLAQQNYQNVRSEAEARFQEEMAREKLKLDQESSRRAGSSDIGSILAGLLAAQSLPPEFEELQTDEYGRPILDQPAFNRGPILNFNEAARSGGLQFL